MSFEDFSKATAQFNAGMVEEMLHTGSIAGIPYSNSLMSMPGYTENIDANMQYRPKYALLIRAISSVSEAGLYLDDTTEHVTLDLDAPANNSPEIVRYLEARRTIGETFYKSLGKAVLSEAAAARHTLMDAQYYEWAGKLGLSAGIGATALCREICKMYDIPFAVGIELQAPNVGEKLAAVYYPLISNPETALESLKTITARHHAA